MTFDEVCAACATATGMDRGEWADFLSLEPAQQEAAARAYAGMDWTRSASAVDAVLAALSVGAAVAGAVSGIAGAVPAVRALFGSP